MKNGQMPLTEERLYRDGDSRRYLIDAALTLVTEEQNWTFSLREVARRAGVSHNAPYKHFADKRALLADVAAAGFVTLRERMLAAIAAIKSAEKALVKSGIAYVKFGVENPAHYRLMFGLPEDRSRSEALVAAAAAARSVVAGIIDRGIQDGTFVPSPGKKEEARIAIISAYSMIHGLTMLAIDGRIGPPPLDIDSIAKETARLFCYGLVRK
jgi:AcrR family transcriptional regulator